jgi:hypothetical protein
MPTGIESWANPAEIGPIYPFVGTEVLLTIIAVVLWIAWHVITAREENQQWRELDDQYAAEPPAS